MTQKTALIVGVGNMGSSLIKGLLHKSLVDFAKIKIFDPSDEKTALFASEKRVDILKDLSGKRDEVIVVLCIKPQDLKTVAADLKKNLNKNALLVSILAGITISDISETFDFSGAVVRAMPNIAGMVGQAATAMCGSDGIDAAHASLAERVFQSIGEAYWTKEMNLDAVTGLSGSGPAYVYMVIEALTDGGVKMGLPRPLALSLATQTVLGSAALVKETGLHPAVLRDQVTTPGGTTINAIHELEAHGLRAMLMSAVATATKQSARLRKKLAKS